ncbi:hypothetical protein ACLIA0_10955 [Bacillaceae bacterium W0354]
MTIFKLFYYQFEQLLSMFEQSHLDFEQLQPMFEQSQRFLQHFF